MPTTSTLLSPEVLARAARLTLVTRRRLTARGAGGHRSARGGHSLEFKDHRPYARGDDVRMLDWSLLARTRRPWLRVHHDEEEQHVVLLIDASASMASEAKLLRARQLAAALAAMVLRAGDRVSAHTFGHGGGAANAPLRGTRPLRGRAGMTPLLGFLDQVDAARGRETLEHALSALVPRLSGRGAIVLLSDFLTHGDLGRAANLAAGAGFEPIGLQLLGPGELRPELEDDVRLVDEETGDVLDVAAGDELLRRYDDALRAQQQTLSALCAGRGGRFVRLDASQEPLAMVYGPLRASGVVR